MGETPAFFPTLAATPAFFPTLAATPASCDVCKMVIFWAHALLEDRQNEKIIAADLQHLCDFDSPNAAREVARDLLRLLSSGIFTTYV